jgi:hypothetical protein
MPFSSIKKYGPIWIGLVLCTGVLMYALSQSSPRPTGEDPLEQIRQEDTPNSRR